LGRFLRKLGKLLLSELRLLRMRDEEDEKLVRFGWFSAPEISSREERVCRASVEGISHDRRGNRATFRVWMTVRDELLPGPETMVLMLL
jgi:hypothetical protein